MKDTIQKRIDELTEQRAAVLKMVEAEWKRQADKIQAELLTANITPIDARLEELGMLLSLADMPLPVPAPEATPETTP